MIDVSGCVETLTFYFKARLRSSTAGLLTRAKALDENPQPTSASRSDPLFHRSSYSPALDIPGIIWLPLHAWALRTHTTVFNFRHHFTAQQGKGPSPVVMERFQGVASQLMNQASMLNCVLFWVRVLHLCERRNRGSSGLVVLSMMTAATWLLHSSFGLTRLIRKRQGKLAHQKTMWCA